MQPNKTSQFQSILLFILTCLSCQSQVSQTTEPIISSKDSIEKSLKQVLQSEEIETPDSIFYDSKNAIAKIDSPEEKQNKISSYYTQLNLSIWKYSNWKPKIDTIHALEFDTTKLQKIASNASNIKKKINYDSILAAYPNEIILSDSCCTLKGINEDIIMCQSINNQDERANSRYSFQGKKNDYLIFFQSGYEWWSYTLFHPQSKKTYGFANEPIFLDQRFVFAYGNYYREGQFEIHDLLNDRKFGFDSYNWTLLNIYYDPFSFFIEFRSLKDFSIKKYLSININS